MTAVTAAAVIAAGMTFTVMMLTMMIALHIGIVCQNTCQECFYCSVCIAGNTAEQLDTGCRQSHLGTTTDTAANQNIRLQGLQYASQSTVSTAVGIHYFGGYDLTFLHIIDLEHLGVAEMLEDVSVFISNRNSHTITVLPFLILYIKSMFETGIGIAALGLTVAESVIAAFNPKRPPVYQHISQFLSGGSINQLYGCSGNTHPFTAFFLR